MCDHIPKNISLGIDDTSESVFTKSKIVEPQTCLINNIRNELQFPNDLDNSKSYNIIKNANTPTIHRFRSKSETPGNFRFSKNNITNDNLRNIRISNKETGILTRDYSSNLKKKNVGISILNNSNKSSTKTENRKVLGYNYFTNRNKNLETDDYDIIKNIPLSIYVGTWNCEYFDFSKNYECQKKRHTTNDLRKNIEDNKYSKGVNDRYSMRSVTPLIFVDPMKQLDYKYLHKKEYPEQLKSSVNNNEHNRNITKEKEECKKIYYNDKYDIENYCSGKNLERSSVNYHNMNITIINTKSQVENEIYNGNCKELKSIKKSRDIAINYKKPNDDTLKVHGNIWKEKGNTRLHDNLLKKKDDINDLRKLNLTSKEHDLKKNYEFLQIKNNYCPTSKPKERFIFSCWIQPYYDVYVICLQESISDNIIECLSVYLKEVNQETYVFLPLADYKLSGYGDGAFLQMKSTTIAAWVRKTKLYPNGPVKLCASKSIAFNKLNNSKGCVSILLNIFDQFILFIGCHMPAKDQELRQKSREFILTKLSEYFSNKVTSNFKDVFHHVIWMGDFNFRVQGIDVEKVVQYLKSNNIKELLKHDEGHSSYSCDLSISFQELPISFLPTYKKKGGRPVINRNDSKWVEKEYKLIHNIKWYKGGKQEPRIPSWTDRIFKWSSEKTKKCLAFVPNSYVSPIPEENSILMASDHNPVSCCFQMYKMKNEEDIPLTKNVWRF